MKAPLYICGIVCSFPVPADVSVAMSTILQTVDLTEMSMSTEGGEARLSRANDAKHGFCKIDVVHYGESGKTTLVFEFGAKLFAAETKQYRYDSPIYVNANARSILSKRTTLASREGRNLLRKDFETYKALFEPHQLAKCSGR